MELKEYEFVTWRQVVVDILQKTNNHELGKWRQVKSKINTWVGVFCTTKWSTGIPGAT